LNPVEQLNPVEVQDDPIEQVEDPVVSTEQTSNNFDLSKIRPIAIDPLVSKKPSIVNPLNSLRNTSKYVKLKREINDLEDLETCIRFEWPSTSATHSSRVNCTVCGLKGGDHKMTSIVRKCMCKLTHCNLKFKINKCDCNKFAVFSKGDDIHTHYEFLKDNDDDEDENKNKRKTRIQVGSQVRGVHGTIKKLLMKYMDEDEDLEPKRMLVKVIRDWKKKKQFNKEIIPQLTQVISYCIIYILDFLFLIN
jgi:hypothetical protein